MTSAFSEMLVFPLDVNFKSIIESDEYDEHKVILLLQTCTASLTECNVCSYNSQNSW